MPEPAPLPLAPGSSSGSPAGAANAPAPPAGGPAGIRAPNSRPDDAGSGDPASIIARNADNCVCVVSSCPASRQWHPPAGNRRKSTPFQEGEEDGRRVKNGEAFEENPGEEHPISNRRFQPSFISPLTKPHPRPKITSKIGIFGAKPEKSSINTQNRHFGGHFGHFFTVLAPRCFQWLASLVLDAEATDVRPPSFLPFEPCHPEFINSGWIQREVFLCFYVLGKVANLQ